ncbi:MAG: hypothetical protein LBV29_00010 [Azoarcus sp.]|jgi:hypothetical protein|nr:hypothetical protein [Azoarcus sp.]
MDQLHQPVPDQADTAHDTRSRPADWLWRPWYAKLWWCAMPVWWLGVVVSSKTGVMAGFFESAFGGLLHILFMPMIALMVLGVGYVQHWLSCFPKVGGGEPVSDEELAMILQMQQDEQRRASKARRASMDICDPRSGGLFIGTPTSFQHPNRRI